MNPRFEFSLKVLGTWFGCGLVPVAPGTVGTLGAIPLVWWLQKQGELPYLFITLLLVVFAIAVAQIYEETVATDHDPAEFVLDEVVGFLVTMALVPFTWPYILLGFVVFRFLDMVKPWPISWVDRNVPGGFGAVADDLVAGILASLFMQVTIHFKWIEVWMS